MISPKSTINEYILIYLSACELLESIISAA
jgi:hypothetical protein